MEITLTLDPTKQLEIADWARFNPDDFKRQWDCQTVKFSEAKAAQAEAETALADGTADHRRLNALETDRLRAAKPKIRAIMDEGINNPAGDLVALAEQKALVVQETGFLSSLVHDLVSRELPERACRAAEAEWKARTEFTMVRFCEHLDVLRRFIELNAALDAEQGLTVLQPSQKVLESAGRLMTAYNEARLAHQRFIDANSQRLQIANALMQ